MARALLVLVLVALVVLPMNTARAQRERWELRIPERVELIAGTSGTLPIELAVDRGLHVSRDAAIIVDLAPDSALAIKRRRVGRADAIDPDADAPRFAIAVRAETAGDFTMRVHLRFWLCGQKVCRPVDARRNIAFAVAAASASATP
jgi:hypothetical protein